MSFEDLERERKAAGISESALCRRAGIHPTTYNRRKRNPDGGTTRTFDRLRRALDAFVAERGKRVRA